MADGDRGKDQPSLELPKLGWRRKRRDAAPHLASPGSATEPPIPPPPDPPPPLPTPPPPPPPVPELEEQRAVCVDEAEHSTLVETVPAPVAVRDEPVDVPEAEPSSARRTRRERGPGGMPAVVLTGGVVGLGLVGLTWASLRLCEAVQGTSSCGDAGYGLLFMILVAMVVVGALLLRATHVPEPGSTSFLAVGLSSVLALLFLVDSLLDRSMVAVIPLLSVGAFAAAHWVTRTFIEPAER